MPQKLKKAEIPFSFGGRVGVSMKSGEIVAKIRKFCDNAATIDKHTLGADPEPRYRACIRGAAVVLGSISSIEKGEALKAQKDLLADIELSAARVMPAIDLEKLKDTIIPKGEAKKMYRRGRDYS